jgi:hypothetical protein
MAYSSENKNEGVTHLAVLRGYAGPLERATLILKLNGQPGFSAP